MKFQTQSIHGGDLKKPFNALNFPIFQTSTFSFENVEHAEDVMDFKSSDYVYTRGNNPTLKLLERRLAELEGGVDSVAFASGMGAISAVLMSLLKSGDNIICSRTVYGSTHSFIRDFLSRYGISSTLIDCSNLSSVEQKITRDTKVLYIETPANPTLEILDIKKLSDLAHSYGVKVVCDNTFASPYFQKPLLSGADVSVHSATKYLSGHGDVVAGIATSKDQDYINSLKFEFMCELGQVLSPFDAWLILRGIKTLAVRMREHERNALEIAKFLEGHKRVKKVYYPGLKNDRGYELARKQMSGFGGIISFEVGDLPKAKEVVNKLKLFTLAVSLGDCESLVEIPSLLTHRSYSEEELLSIGINPALIRLSIGLEDSEDLISDLEQAL